jgi:hypothetical protein
MKESTQAQLMKSVMLWELFDESLSLIDDRDLEHRMKYLFKKISNSSKLMRSQLEGIGAIDQEDDDYEKVKESLIELVINELNTIKTE